SCVMARELVERNGIGETADAVWKALNTEHHKLFPTAPHPNDDVSSFEPSGNFVTDFATLKWPHFDRHIWPHPNR
ncbi:MAG TPA: hypothetical protein VK657_00755, partial [Terriglobales bacterium]|nr:hypothetical protein [Terriglobales bacterium]